MTSSNTPNNITDLLAPSSKFANAERPFTELIALLKLSRVEKCGKTGEISVDTLRALYKHTTNAMGSLFLGLESLGYALGIAGQSENMRGEYASGTGYLVKSLANLLGALHDFRIDIEKNIRDRK